MCIYVYVCMQLNMHDVPYETCVGASGLNELIYACVHTCRYNRNMDVYETDWSSK